MTEPGEDDAIREHLATVLPLFGTADTTLLRLAEDFPAYLITHEYERFRGFVHVAKRVRESDGPFLVITEDADEMRQILNGKCH